MSGLDELQPLITPPAVSLWPPAPGWWLVLALLPVLAFGLWRLRRYLPRRKAMAPVEQPLDPVRQEALAELARLPKPYDGAPAG
ncbi:DUF4381 domain-containing protein, partial [Pseudomonas sp.]